MKKVINGKMYNTETAQPVGSWDNGRSYSDFSHCEEKLFRKKTGEFFLYGTGGPMSSYAKSCGQNEWCGGEAIEPLTVKEAMNWAEKRLDGDEYSEIFGEPDEAGEKITLGIQVTAEAARLLKAAAAEAGKTQSNILEELIIDALK